MQRLDGTRSGRGPLAGWGVIAAALSAVFVMTGCKVVEDTVKPAEQMMAPPDGATTAPDGGPIVQDPLPYTLVPGDEIAVNVLGQPELSFTTRLDADGAIQYPYLNYIKLEGLTTNDVRRKIVAGLKEFYVDPIVTVNMVSQEQQFVRVVGEVTRQGRFAISRDMRITDAIAEAGGLTLDAAQDRVVLIRRVSENDIRAGFFDYRSATLDPINSGAYASDIPLRRGDTIFVPRNARAQWESAFQFISSIVNPVVDVERAIVLYPDARDVLETGDVSGRNTIVVR